MQKFKKTALILLLAISGTIVQAQDFVTDIKQYHRVMNETEQFYAEILTSIYETATSKEPLTVDKSLIQKNGDEYHCKMQDTELLINEKFTIMALHDEQIIAIKERDQQTNEKTVPEAMNIDMDALLENYTSVQFIGEVNGKLHYRYLPETGLLKQIDIMLDKKNHWMTNASYIYHENQQIGGGKVEIVYKNITTTPQFSAQQFSESKFFEKKEGKYILTAFLKGYQLIN